MTEKIYLFCFPFGGAGVSMYNGWNELFDDNVEIVPMPLPGRERLIDHEPYRNLHTAAKDFAEYINENYSDKKMAFFGHCFLGSVMAYEVIRILEKKNGLEIIGLFVSAGFTPDSKRDYCLDLTNEDEFINGVEKLTGYKNDALEIPELRELLLPALIADFEMDINYCNKDTTLIKTPIVAIYAENDTFVPKEEVAKWANYTQNEFSLHKVQGVHLYIVENKEEAIDIIKDRLTNWEQKTR